ncbi:hypothetical protein [Nitrosomonas sp. Is37]|uniref:hypothetical protein n=1 Tax=Nitrosomonas sp. Is37 TaxID=3080535 RepID=UPI00294B6B9F|nr:hypothetical protein [Nitrosomonas sp. Is37]MDV6344298.1 hypothetical protein [Nitrosomonas sp. Is37]
MLQNATVVSHGIIITANREIIQETINLPRNPSFVKDDGGYHCIISEDACVIDDAVVLASKQGIRNYGHILVEVIPRLAYVKSIPGFSEQKILLHEKAVSNWREIFNNVGLDTKQVIHHK